MDGLSLLGGIFALIVIICMAPWLIYLLWDTSRKDRVRNICHKLIENHSDSLAIERTKYARTDPYGQEDTDRWFREVRYFMEHILASDVHEQFGNGGMRRLGEMWSEIADEVDRAARKAQRAIEETTDFSDDLTALEYEQFCAAELRRFGWNVSSTQASRDQGVDLVAGKLGRKVVIQCKKYSRPVGNKAVQEIVAGQKVHNADEAAVVTNASFTRPAEELASANGVKLLHHLQLDQL